MFFSMYKSTPRCVVNNYFLDGVIINDSGCASSQQVELEGHVMLQ